MATYQFPCGCSFKVIEDNPPEGVVPLLEFDSENIREDCPATWGLLGRGLTKGVFQLESNLGKQWTRKLKPENLQHITALGSILRPGALRAIDEDGVSMTQHYCRRKNKEEEVKPYHPVIDAILGPTYNTICYQEQILAIARDAAGFNLQEADMLRKSFAKKLPEEMAKCKIMFIEGAKKAKVISIEQAEEIFDWIEKSQRYLFNASHSCCYGLLGYECAYIKAHFPIAFFTSWLLNSHYKQEPLQEINECVNDAKLFDIIVEAPDLRCLDANFQTDRKTIRFGLSNIKGVGDAQVKKLVDAVASTEIKLGKPLKDWDWFDFLIQLSDSLTVTVVNRLIEVGALRWLNKQRRQMLAEYAVWSRLTDKEREWVKKAGLPALAPLAAAIPASPLLLIDCLGLLGRSKKEGGGAANINRVSIIQSQKLLLQNPPSPLIDTPNWIAWLEEQLLGISITCSRIDSCDLSEVNTTCKEYLAGKTGFIVLGVEVNQYREVKTKRGKTPGQKMAFLTVSDSSCALQDVVCFPETWKEYENILSLRTPTGGNSVIIHGERDGKKDSNTLIVKKVWQAT